LSTREHLKKIADEKDERHSVSDSMMSDHVTQVLPKHSIPSGFTSSSTAPPWMSEHERVEEHEEKLHLRLTSWEKDCTKFKSSNENNPMSYHCGSVWPHDNSLIAFGMARYGYQQEASVISFGAIRSFTSLPRLPTAGVVLRKSAASSR
jgi:hypothetical protein